MKISSCAGERSQRWVILSAHSSRSRRPLSRPLPPRGFAPPRGGAAAPSPPPSPARGEGADRSRGLGGSIRRAAPAPPHPRPLSRKGRGGRPRKLGRDPAGCARSPSPPPSPARGEGAGPASRVGGAIRRRRSPALRVGAWGHSPHMKAEGGWVGQSRAARSSGMGVWGAQPPAGDSRRLTHAWHICSITRRRDALAYPLHDEGVPASDSARMDGRGGRSEGAMNAGTGSGNHRRGGTEGAPCRSGRGSRLRARLQPREAAWRTPRGSRIAPRARRGHVASPRCC